MSSVENLLYYQQQLEESIDKVAINFKKDGPARKTSSYIQQKLRLLDEYWSDFSKNHEKLVKFNPKTDSYFTENQFEVVQEKYSRIKGILLSYQQPADVPIDVNNPPASTRSGSSQSPVESLSLKNQGVHSKSDDLIRKQSSNFRALQRTMSGINLDLVTEKWEFEDLLRILHNRWSIIDTLHWELDSELNGSNQEYEQSFDHYERLYNNIKKSINSKLWSVSHREKSTPHMEIPSFHGNYQQWVSFKDLFVETIHSNPSLSNAQKMQFLKSKLKGEAEKLVQHLHISSDNYSICWDLLNHRYENKNLIFSTHIRSLLNCQVMTQASVQDIKNLHDTTRECLNAIRNLGINVDTWDPFLVIILSEKLDKVTYKNYIESIEQPKELPVLSEFLNFLESTFVSMESTLRKQESVSKPISQNQFKPSFSQSGKNKSNYNKQHFSSNNQIVSQPITSNVKSNNTYFCILCNKSDHGLYYCKQFLNMPPYQKLNLVKKHYLCFNCLYNHNGNNCISTKRCQKCNGAHNTILHEAFVQSNSSNTKQYSYEQNKKQSNSHVLVQRDIPEVLLATSIIKIKSVDGTYQNLRALIDQGSQTSLVTEHAVQSLGLPRSRCKGVISGVGSKQSNCKGMLTLSCLSVNSDFSFKINALIMNNLVNKLPAYTFANPSWEHLEGLQLADPEFYISRPVDLLLGADIYSTIILEGICRSQNNLPIAQQTRLGWIVTGAVRSLQCNVVFKQLEEMHQFWEVEDISEESNLSAEDQECIEHYKRTTKRKEDGKYEVKLPLKTDISDKLGLSKQKAVSQFRSLENKFSRNSEVAYQYKSFINEYQTLGHMTPVNNLMKSESDCYLPHHCVIREDATTTKLRVVFNASARTSSGMSLNDLMYRGPNLQQDLQTLMIKWRQYEVAFTADIEKMYRCIWVNEEHQKYQKIVWRDSPTQPLQDFMLTTVTYGTKAAPFLAMMTLKQLGYDEKRRLETLDSSENTEQDQEVIRILDEQFYMDDLIHGSHSILAAQQIQTKLISLLNSAGFNLRKWKCNKPELLQEVDTNENFDFKYTESTKTLGLIWNPQQDYFTFQSKVNLAGKYTKRNLLSSISKLFDPLGWLSPISTKLKLLFQKVYLQGLDWDEELPKNIIADWKKIEDDISSITQFKLSRWLKTKQCDNIELHGFCDASNKAYACIIYCRINDNQERKASCVLVVGKARIISASKELTLPRLELLSALLLSKLMAKVTKSLSSHNIKLFGWSDSMVTLGWLNGDPDKWKPFVANRVKQITQTMPSECWNYVKSADNPADCASRGLSAAQLKEHSLWWNGPSWLINYQYSSIKHQFSTSEEVKKSVQVNIVQKQEDQNIISILLNRYSSFSKVIHVLAWMYRFISRKSSVIKQNYLSLSELRAARITIIKFVQLDQFESEIKELKEGKSLNHKSTILSLNPFLGQDGLLHVGGRLRNSNMNTDMKYPIIIPNQGRFTELLIKYAHSVTYHGGVRVTLAFIRQRYWLISGNRTVKKWLRLCVTCRKCAPLKQEQIMGDLPDARCNPSRPFYHTGIDYTGHVFIKASKGRNARSVKGYIAVFVCMASKAVHLELVSDLSTSAFLAALKRMAARRGTPGHLYSDNGTNFVGANNILQAEYDQIKQVFNDNLLTEVTSMEITWHFNAPSWPSAGGLWEAAVKSLKYHLVRVVGEQKLTFEEYSTVLAQIEACLNSRPLCSLSDNPDDLEYLTPSHFLTGGPTLSLYETEKDMRTRWYLAQKIFNDVWKRWKTEYLTSLTARSKWRRSRENLQLGDVVLIHEDNLSAGKWAMGRVTELHPGKDGAVRVVTLKTKKGSLKRPIVKLSVLPINEKGTEDPPTEKISEIKIKRPAQKTLISVVLAVMFFMTLISNSQCDNTLSFNYTTLSDQQRLYFDKVSNMQLISDRWKMVVYYNLSSYWQGVTSLNKYIKNLEEMNEEIKTPHQVILLQLSQGISELQYYNQLLLSQHSEAHARPRRGLINGVGYIANTLFGVLDQHFAEQYERDIKETQMNQQHLGLMWKNQTSIIEAEYNLLKRTEESLNKQQKIINKNFISIEKELKMLYQNEQSLFYVNQYTLQALSASNLLQQLRNIQNNLLEMVTDIHHGDFNIHILTPDQLEKELSVIASQIPKDSTLPVNPQAELRNLYQLMSVRTRMTENYLLFEINLPLVSRDRFEVFSVIPVPFKKEQKMISIKPLSEYVALNIKKNVYIKMRLSDIKSCLHQYHDLLLCEIAKPIYNLNQNEKLCIRNHVTNECITESNHCEDKWVELNKDNHYLYFCCNKCTILLLCKHDMSSHILSNAGIVSVGQDCTIKTKLFTLQPRRQDYSIIKTESNIILPEISPINYVMNSTVSLDSIIDKDNLEQPEQMRAIHKDIEFIKNQEPLLTTVSYHDIHHYTLIYVMIVLLVLVGIAVIWKKQRKQSEPDSERAAVAAGGRPGSSGTTTHARAVEVALGVRSPAPAPVTTSDRAISSVCDRCKCKSEIHLSEQKQSNSERAIKSSKSETNIRVDKSTTPMSQRQSFVINH